MFVRHTVDFLVVVIQKTNYHSNKTGKVEVHLKPIFETKGSAAGLGFRLLFGLNLADTAANTQMFLTSNPHLSRKNGFKSLALYIGNLSLVITSQF